MKALEYANDYFLDNYYDGYGLNSKPSISSHDPLFLDLFLILSLLGPMIVEDISILHIFKNKQKKPQLKFNIKRHSKVTFFRWKTMDVSSINF